MMGAGATVKPENGRYVALDSAVGVKRLLGDYHALNERRYCGDTTASDLLIDLATAIEKADLTDRQRQALCLVFVEDLTQESAGERMGVRRQAVERYVKVALAKVARVYEYWARHGEGYSLTIEGESE